MQINGISSTIFTGYYPEDRNVNKAAQKMNVEESWNHLNASLELSKTKHVDLYVKADKNGELNYYVVDKLGMNKYPTDKSVLKQFRPFMNKECFKSLQGILLNKDLTNLDKAVAVTKAIDTTIASSTLPKRVESADEFKNILWNNIK